VETIKAIDFFVTEEFGSRFYDSCKDVKFAAMNTRALDFVGGGARNYSGERSLFPFCIWNINLHRLALEITDGLEH
jgi:hypothetical protein